MYQMRAPATSGRQSFVPRVCAGVRPAIWPTGTSKGSEKLLEKPAPATTFYGAGAAANNATSGPRYQLLPCIVAACRERVWT